MGFALKGRNPVSVGIAAMRANGTIGPALGLHKLAGEVGVVENRIGEFHSGSL
jgi:hypothetical protein